MPNKKNYRSWVIASVVAVLSISWLWLLRLHMTDLTGGYMAGYFIALFGFLVIVGVSSAIYLLLIRYFVREYRRHKSISPWFLVKLFFFWAGAEYLVSVVISLIWLGKGGSLDTVFPFGSFSPILAYTPLVFLSRLVGFYGLSAALVVLVSAIAFKKLRRYAAVTTVIILISTCMLWIGYRNANGKPVDIQILSYDNAGVIPPFEPGHQLTVMPEYAVDMLDLNNYSKLFGPADKESFYISSRHEDSDGVQNVLLLASNRRQIIEKRPKSRLIPAGEYLPFVADGITRVIGAKDMRQKFLVERQLAKGPVNHNPMHMINGIELGSGICASIISPDDYKKFARNGATVFTNSAALNIFDSFIFDIQHTGLAKFMAVSNARPFAQSSLASESFMLDHNGHYVARIHNSPGGAVSASLTTNSRKTPYTYIGEWVAYIGIILIVYSVIKRILTDKKWLSKTQKSK